MYMNDLQCSEGHLFSDYNYMFKLIDCILYIVPLDYMLGVDLCAEI